MVELLEALMNWVGRAPDVRVATIFGSHARAFSGEQQPADPWSDIDLQIVTTKPSVYLDRSWTNALGGQVVEAYAVRPVFGGVQKVTVLFSRGSADLVIIPYRRLCLGRVLFSLNLHHLLKGLKKGLGELALVMSPGHRVIKGGPGWADFYARVVREVDLPHLTDDEAVALAEIAYVDAVSVLNKLSRGEFVAAQRWLHRSIIEVNFKIMHEIRVRRKEVSYPDGRRVEQILSPTELATQRFETLLDERSLRSTTLAALAATRTLISELTGRAPTWPDISAHRDARPVSITPAR